MGRAAARADPESMRRCHVQHPMMAAGLALAALAAAWTPAATQVSDSAQPPAPGTTRYTLAEVAGKPLPAQVEKEWRCREDVTAGSLTLSEDGRWLLETTTRQVCGDRTEEDRDDDDGTYRTEGGTIHFLDDDGRENTDRGWGIGTEIDLDELRAGTIADDGTLRVQLADGRTTLVFRR